MDTRASLLNDRATEHNFLTQPVTRPFSLRVLKSYKDAVNRGMPTRWPDFYDKNSQNVPRYLY
jgi:hypothetical protein